jgi:serine/threonine protein kinase/HEAT repeat protein
MADQEYENAKRRPASETPAPQNDVQNRQWTLKTNDTGAFSDSQPPASNSGTSASSDSSSESRSGASSDSIADISNTGTHFGNAFQRAIQLESGAIIGGSYRIVRLIGKGGMGQVYLAEHLTLAKKCALKVMSSNQVTEKAWIRFQTEAKAIAGLDHANLVRVSDLGIHENSLPFFAMEYVDGQSIAQRLADHGPMDQSTTLEVLQQICDGIECAHKQGIVHRDLKPANIMLVEDSQKPGHFKIKILDFGLAKLSQREAAEINLTATGEIFGSPLYMSPEQCAGEATDMRSDIYSLGCTVFECLTGQPPFTGEMAIPIMHRKIFGEAPTLGSVAPEKAFLPNLELIVAKMLKREPKGRYQTIADLKSDLQSAISTEPLPSSKRSEATEKSQPVNQSGRKKESIWASLPSVSSKHNWPKALAVLVIAGGVLTLSAAFLLKVVISATPTITVPTDGTSPLADFLGPEDWLARIQNARAEQPRTTHYPPTQPDIIRLIAHMNRVECIVADAQAHLLAMGERSIPACINDLANQTSSSNIAGEALRANGAAAVEPLLGLLKQKPNRSAVIVPLLSNMGPSVGNVLCKQASSGRDKTEKAFAIETLVEIARLENSRKFPFSARQPIMTESNRTALLKQLTNETDSDLRKALIGALAYFESPTADAVSDLSTILANDRSEIVQEAAARTLGRMLSGSSPHASVDMVKALCIALSYPNQDQAVKVACLDALGRAPSSLEPARLVTIRDATRDSSETVRQRALQTLARLAVHNHAYLPDLIGALQEPDSFTVDVALSALTEMGPQAKDALPAVIKLAQANHSQSNGQAIKAICAIGVENSPAGMALLIKVLDQPPTTGDWRDFDVIVGTLYEMGPAAKKAIPSLQRLANGEHALTSINAKSALEKINQ